MATTEPRIWYHQRKGRIVGHVERADDTWTYVRLVEDAWADARHRHFTAAGQLECYRTSLLVEMAATPTEEN